MKCNFFQVSCIILLSMSLLEISLTKTLQQNGSYFESPYSHTINQLYSNLMTLQQTQDNSFRVFPPRFETKQGLFESHIKFNFMDKSNSLGAALIREHFGIKDNNMFVTSYILTVLLESFDLGAIQLSNDEFISAVQSLLQFQDKNSPLGVPVYNFWEQSFDQKNHVWIQQPSNLEGLVDVLSSTMSHIPSFITKYLPIEAQYLVPILSDFMVEFRLPPDSDDSSAMLALGGILSMLGSKYSGNTFFEMANYQWKQVNYDYQTYFAMLKRYSYQPFAAFNKNKTDDEILSYYSDVIDPRTYYVLHDFLNKKYAQAIEKGIVPSLILPTTWLTNIQDSKFPDVNQPLNLTQVDFSVSINNLYGMSLFLLTHANLSAVNEIFDSDIKQMYTDIVDLMEFGITSNIVITRRDIALVYYPSVTDFYWFCARTLNLLEANQITTRYAQFDQMLDYARDKLATVLREVGYKQILSLSSMDSDGNLFWDEFLGDFANVNRGEDRMFATAMALNCLLDIFTVSNSNQIPAKITYRDNNVPSDVVRAIQQSATYLNTHVLSEENMQMNAFFSGSGKTWATAGPFYPSNLHYYNNGTNLDPQQATPADLFCYAAVKGYIPQEQYSEWLKMDWFGKPVFTQFEDFNNPQFEFSPIGFPFWSSRALTFAMNIRALSKLQNLESN